MNRPDDRTNLDELDDDQLVELARGDRLNAFNVLVHRHRGYLVAICYSHVGMAVAEDLAQDSILKAWLQLKSYRRQGKFRAWLGTITRNTCRDYLRYQNRRPSTSLDKLVDQTGDGFSPEANERSPEDQVLDEERLRLVMSAIDSLPEEQRQVLILREIGQLDYREIADATGWSLGTVKSRISRGRVALRAILRERGDLEL